MVEISRRRLLVFVVLAFVGGVVVERWLLLTEPVVRVVAPVTAAVGGPLLWLAVGVLAGAGGMMFFRRMRETSSLDKVRTPRFKRDPERF